MEGGDDRSDGPPVAMRTLSVIIPIYNEARYLERVLDGVEQASLPQGIDRQIICVDDCSTDGTTELLGALAARRPHLQVLRHVHNRGKGAAIRTGLTRASGDLLLIQDADLEYDAADYKRLLAPILDGRADVVFGSRFRGESRRVGHFWHRVGNVTLTTLSNMFSNLDLTDMECCYKVFRREVIQRITLEEDRFGIEPELAAKVARLRARVFEVPVCYSGRSYAEGKKIGWKDSLSAVRCIVQYGLTE